MIVFRNFKAGYLWGFMAIFLAFVAAMSYVLFRDGPPPGYSQAEVATIMACFWIGGLGGFSFVASRACFIITVSPKSVHIARQYPFGRKEDEIPLSQILQARVFDSRDDEGDPYFYARIVLADDTAVDLFESHERQRCEEICASFNRALSGNNGSGGAV